jgi:hypothetical protein
MIPCLGTPHFVLASCKDMPIVTVKTVWGDDLRAFCPDSLKYQDS